MSAAPPPASRVAWAGAQRDVLAGNLKPTITLGELRHLEHLYALGPVEGLTGEISVFDGVPLIARVIGSTVVVDGDRDVGACFLVYADVPSWRWTTMRSSLIDADLESHVATLAASHDLDDGAPLAFLLRGVASTLVFHVLDKRDGLPHSPERHEQAKVRLTLRDCEIEVIGFLSASHRGIFTPADRNVHMHFRTTDEHASGHVERLDLAPDWTLGLPVTMFPSVTSLEERTAP